MEEIYPPESFGSSNRFSLKNYFDEFKNKSTIAQQIETDVNETEYLLTIKDLMGPEVCFNDIIHLSKTCR